jgi:hypothetical protein
MQTYRAVVKVGQDGRIEVSGAPFPPGEEVEVVVSDNRLTREQRLALWDEAVRKLRSTPGVEQITDEDIEAEIEAYLLGVSACARSITSKTRSLTPRSRSRSAIGFWNGDASRNSATAGGERATSSAFPSARPAAASNASRAISSPKTCSAKSTPSTTPICSDND